MSTIMAVVTSRGGYRILTICSYQSLIYVTAKYLRRSLYGIRIQDARYDGGAPLFS